MLTRVFAFLEACAIWLETASLARPKMTVIVGIAFALMAAVGLSDIKFANDYRVFFEPSDPHRAQNEQLERDFTKGDSVNFVLHAKSGDMLDRTRLAAIESLTEKAWRLPGATRVDSLTSYQDSFAQGDDLVVQPLVSRAKALTAQRLAQVRAIALKEHAIQGRLLSKDGKTAQVIVTINLKANDTAMLGSIANQAAALKNAMAAQYPDLTVATTGVVLLSHSFYSVTQSDLMRLVPIMVAFLFFAIAFFFRSWLAAFATIIVLALSVVATMGLAGWLGYSLSPASGQVPVIILTIATAEAIHLIGVTHVLEKRGMPRMDAIRGSIRENHAPIALTSFTDVLGFLCFNFSDTPPFRDLGNIAAFGAIVAYFFSVFFLPALLGALPIRPKSELVTKEHSVEKLAGWAIQRRVWVLGFFSALGLGLGMLAPTLETRDNFVEWLSPHHPFRKDAEFINAHLPGIYTLNYGLKSGNEGGIADPAYLAAVERFTRWLERQPEVADVGSIVDVMKRLNRNMHGDDPSFFNLPENRELAAQYLVLYEMNLAQGQDLSNQITMDKSASRVVVALNNVSSEQMVALKERADNWLNKNTPTVMHAPGVGTSLMFAYLTQENTQSMVTGTLASFLLIGLMTAMALRSIKLGLVSLIPSILPVVMAFGAWKLMDGTQGLYAAFVTSCALGLTVDSVTHFMMKFGEERHHASGNAIEAVLRTFRSVGLELWISSAVLVIGFLVLTFSDFAVIAKLGAMVAVIFIFAVATTFVMLPALMSLLGRGPFGGDAIDKAPRIPGARQQPAE